jgi:hypothetical protein
MHRSIPAWSLACALALAFAADAADPVRFDIKTGLWEMTSTGKASGQMPIPEDILQKLSPERREKILASVQSLASKPITHKSCVTADSVARSFTEHETRPGCEQHVVTNTPSELVLTGSCKTERGSDTYKAHFQRQGRDAVTGNFSLVITNGGQTMNVERVVNAKWLGASCGELK